MTGSATRPRRASRIIAALACLAAGLLTAVGCTSASPSPSSSASGASLRSAPLSALATRISSDFPDPSILRVGSIWYAYATNSDSAHVQVARSTDLRKWTVLAKDALPTLPDWARGGDTWAPDVQQLGPKSFVLYFTAANRVPKVQCIGVATGDSPTGPFVSSGTQPLICPTALGGAIDASGFLDTDGTRYLVWKNDGNCCNLDTWLSIVPLSADGLTLTGPSAHLVKEDQPWEGSVVEAPTLLKRDGVYHLFYSAGYYGDDSYAIGHATATSLAGPWKKDADPFLSSDSSHYALVGPGGQDFSTDGASPDDIMVLHAWNGTLTKRQFYVLRVSWADGAPKAIVPAG